MGIACSSTTGRAESSRVTLEFSHHGGYEIP